MPGSRLRRSAEIKLVIGKDSYMCIQRISRLALGKREQSSQEGNTFPCITQCTSLHQVSVLLTHSIDDGSCIEAAYLCSLYCRLGILGCSGSASDTDNRLHRLSCKMIFLRMTFVSVQPLNTCRVLYTMQFIDFRFNEFYVSIPGRCCQVGHQGC